MILQKSFQHDDLVLKKHFLLLSSMLKEIVMLNIFEKKKMCDTFQDSLINRKFKRTAFT